MNFRRREKRGIIITNPAVPDCAIHKVMKQYTVYFSEPVAYTYTTDRFNKASGHWEETEVTEMVKSATFHSLTPAKKLIKANQDKYAGSCITKIWSNGDFENLGEIKLSGSNETYVANTRQKKASY